MWSPYLVVPHCGVGPGWSRGAARQHRRVRGTLDRARPRQPQVHLRLSITSPWPRARELALAIRRRGHIHQSAAITPLMATSTEDRLPQARRTALAQARAWRSNRLSARSLFGWASQSYSDRWCEHRSV